MIYAYNYGKKFVQITFVKILEDFFEHHVRCEDFPRFQLSLFVWCIIPIQSFSAFTYFSANKIFHLTQNRREGSKILKSVFHLHSPSRSRVQLGRENCIGPPRVRRPIFRPAKKLSWEPLK